MKTFCTFLVLAMLASAVCGLPVLAFVLFAIWVGILVFGGFV